MSQNVFSVLFADDTGKDMDVICQQLNKDLRNVQEWLQSNKLSLNVLKTHYMVFTPRNELINDSDVKIHNVPMQRVYATKFLGVQIEGQLTWKTHIEYTCKKLSKCVGILCKSKEKQEKKYINLLSSAYTTHLHTLILFTATMYGETITHHALK